uniref:Uncharacterized protein n=1 Tax=Biomphalaria glabrata TaxID=6526 RepID=A0A2C9KL04_BIOGL
MIIRKKTGSQLLQRLNNRRDSNTSNITSLRRDSNTSNMAPIPRSSIDYGSNALSYDSNKELPPIPSSPDADIPALQLSPEKEERRYGFQSKVQFFEDLVAQQKKKLEVLKQRQSFKKSKRDKQDPSPPSDPSPQGDPTHNHSILHNEAALY